MSFCAEKKPHRIIMEYNPGIDKVNLSIRCLVCGATGSVALDKYQSWRKKIIKESELGIITDEELTRFFTYHLKDKDDNH